MQKKRKNPPAWYTLSNLTNNTTHTIPMNRAARRALMKMTNDIAMMPPVIRPLTKAERLAKIADKEARRAAETRQIEEGSELQHSRVNEVGQVPGSGDSNRHEQSGQTQKEAQAEEIMQRENSTKETPVHPGFDQQGLGVIPTAHRTRL